jgi:hypothetical protein
VVASYDSLPCTPLQNRSPRVCSCLYRVTDRVTFCHAIDNPAKCEFCVAFRLVHGKNTSTAEIHHQLCAAAYGQNVMNEAAVWHRCRIFRDARTRSRLRAKWWAICSEWSCSKSLPTKLWRPAQIPCTFPYEVIRVTLGCHKRWARWLQKCPQVRTKHREWLWRWHFRTVPQIERWIFSHIITSDETWISVVNAETKDQSKQWMHTLAINKPNNPTLSACQRANGICFWDRKALLTGEFIKQGTTIATELYWRTLKNRVNPFRKKGMECWHPV